MTSRSTGTGPIPIRRQLTEQLRTSSEGGGVLRDQACPASGRWPASSAVNPKPVARVIDDSEAEWKLEARRGKGVFVAPAAPPPHHTSARASVGLW